MKVNQDFLIKDSKIINSVTSGYRTKGTIQFIVIHETGNKAEKADALNHAKLQFNGNSRQASWHYTVDSKSIYKSFADTLICWHGGNMYYNTRGIGIEMAVNHKTDAEYQKTLKNTVALVVKLMKLYNIPLANVIQHNKCSGKNCPEILRSGKVKGAINNWSDFIKAIKKEYDKDNKVPEKEVAQENKGKYYKPADKVNKVKVIGNKVNLYSDMEFKHATGGTYRRATVFTIVGTYHYKGGIYRFKTKSGYYITANKNYVQSI